VSDGASKNEVAAREAAVRVYGDGARVDVSKDANGGQIRVLSADSKRLNGWYWDATSLSQNTEDQAWHTLRTLIEDDERAAVKPSK
jgi:hypothetical protein